LKGAGRGQALPKPKAGKVTVASLAAQLEAVLAGQQTMEARLAALEVPPSGRGAGRGAGLLFGPPAGGPRPPGLQQLRALAGPPPPRLGPSVQVSGSSRFLPQAPPPSRPATGSGGSPPAAASPPVFSKAGMAGGAAPQGLEALTQALSEHTRALLQSRSSDPASLLESDSVDGPKPAGAKGALMMDAWKKMVNEQPEKVVASIRRNIREALCNGPDLMLDIDPRSSSAREFLIQETAFDRMKGVTYLMFGLATVFDWLGRGQTKSAEALVGLLLAAGDQATIDGGRWNLAWLYTHLPEPPWARISHRATENLLRPHTKLLNPTWAAAAAAYTRDMSVLHELKRKAAPPDKPEKGAAGKGGATPP